MPFVLNSKVDQGSGAAEGGGARASFKIIGAGGAAERHIQVSVDVNASRKNILAGSVDQSLGILPGQGAAEGDHSPVFNRNIGLAGVGCRDHIAVGNDGVEPHWLIPCAVRARCSGESVMYSIP